MDLAATALWAASAALLLLVLLWAFARARGRRERQRRAALDALDTVAAWPPEAARVLTVDERQAYELLKRAMPGFMILAQVPLSRFVRVPARHPYAEWLRRAGNLSADLLLCDAGSRVLAVIDIRTAGESERGRKRHERMARVLRAAGLQVFTWREGQLPAAPEVRAVMAKLVGPLAPAVPARPPSASRPVPLIPVPDMAEVLAAGDRAAVDNNDPAHEPVPSAFMDDLEPANAGR